jgi:hypothetical protein
MNSILRCRIETTVCEVPALRLCIGCGFFLCLAVTAKPAEAGQNRAAAEFDRLNRSSPARVLATYEKSSGDHLASVAQLSRKQNEVSQQAVLTNIRNQQFAQVECSKTSRTTSSFGLVRRALDLPMKEA